MPKGTKNFFRHSIFMTTDPKVQQLIDDKGMAGYGRYVRMLELMAEQEIVDSVNGSYTFRKNSLKDELKLSKDSINTWIEYVSQVFNMCVTLDGHLVRLEYRNVLKYIGSYDSSLYKVKERKEKEIKENKIKGNTSDNFYSDNHPSDGEQTETNSKDEFKREGEKVKGKKRKFKFFKEENMSDFQKSLYVKDGTIYHKDLLFESESSKIKNIIEEFNRYFPELSYEETKKDLKSILEREENQNIPSIETWIKIYRYMCKNKVLEERL